MVTRILLTVAALILIAQANSAARAMSIVPAIVELADSGNGRSAAIKVYNDGKFPLPVEFFVRRFELNEDGSDRVFSADGEVTVFPPQALIKPGETQIVNVVWTGGRPLEKSRSYYVIVHEVPVEMAADESGVNITVDFSVIANVAPSNATARLSILDTKIEPIQPGASRTAREKTGTHRVTVTAENTGDRHARLSDGELHLRQGSWSMTLRGDDLLEAVGAGIVQPGKRRRFVFPVNVPSAPKTAAAKFRLR